MVFTSLSHSLHSLKLHQSHLSRHWGLGHFLIWTFCLFSYGPFYSFKKYWLHHSNLLSSRIPLKSHFKSRYTLQFTKRIDSIIRSNMLSCKCVVVSLSPQKVARGSIQSSSPCRLEPASLSRPPHKGFRPHEHPQHSQTSISSFTHHKFLQYCPESTILFQPRCLSPNQKRHIPASPL